MKLNFFSKRWKLYSDFEPDELCVRLAEFVKQQGDKRTKKIRFSGKIDHTKGSFKIQPLNESQYRSPPRPLITGNIEKRDMGSEVLLDCDLPGDYKMLFWVALIFNFVIWFFLTIDYLYLDRDFAKNLFFIIGIPVNLVVSFFLALAVYNASLKEAKHVLMVIWKAKEMDA